jgi:hypothetical protein
MQWWNEDDRSADPNWEVDWHTGLAISLLCVIVLAIIVGAVNVMSL